MTKKWEVEFKPTAFKELQKLPHEIQAQVFNFLDKLVDIYSSPRSIGLPLQGKHKGLWRYRIGNYPLICEIQDSRLIILILGVGHRKGVTLRISKQNKAQLALQMITKNMQSKTLYLVRGERKLWHSRPSLVYGRFRSI